MKKYTVIGQRNGRWYDMLLSPLDDEYDARLHAELQNTQVPKMDCKVVEYKAGKYQYWPDLDNDSVIKHRDSLEDILSSVNFDYDSSAVVEYSDGFKTAPKKPEQAPARRHIEPPDYQPSFPIRREPRQAKSKAAQVYGQHVATDTSADHGGWQTSNTRADIHGTPTPGYIAPNEHGQSGSGLAKFSLIIITVLIVASAIFN